MMKASDVSPRMFDNDFLDFFSRTPWQAVPTLYLPLVAGLLWAGSSAGLGVVSLVSWFVTGFVSWTLAEYWLHRTAFHWEPDTWWGPKVHFFLHGVHHTWHRDPYRLVMPPAISLSLAVVFYGVFWALGAALSPWLAPAWHHAAFSGFVLGYVVYDVMHYRIHHVRPRSTYMKRLRAHHMNHHHNNHDRKFGVSMTVWDRVFGTL